MAIQWRQTLFLGPILFCSLLSCSGTGDEGAAPSISPTADTTPPAVLSVFPGKDATGVSLTPAITATFNKVMDVSSLTATTFTVKDAQGNLIPGTISHTGTTATFIPSVALAPSSSYLATITADVIDLAHNALPSDYFWPFATRGPAPPPQYTITGLGTLGGGYPWGINAAGQVVGWSYIVDPFVSHAFLYQSGTMFDLNNLLVNGSGWTLTNATAINDNGQIVGYGRNALWQWEAFLLTPVPPITSE